MEADNLKICRVSQLDPAADPEELMFQIQSEGRKKPISQLEGNQVGGIPFNSG